MKIYIFFMSAICLAFVCHAKVRDSDLTEAEHLLKENRAVIRDLIEKRDHLKQQENNLRDGKSMHESAFRHEMRTRLSALLHWPLLSFSFEPGFWIQREQDELTLSILRQRLVESPLRNIRSTRGDLAEVIHDLQQVEKEFEHAKGRETMLSLQVEEIRHLKGKK